MLIKHTVTGKSIYICRLYLANWVMPGNIPGITIAFISQLLVCSPKQSLGTNEGFETTLVLSGTFFQKKEGLNNTVSGLFEVTEINSM